MAKTKRVKAWGVFDRKNLVKDKRVWATSKYLIAPTEKDAREMEVEGETVRPVTISWKVEK